MTTKCSSPLVVDTDRTHFSHLLLSAIDPVPPGAASFIHYSCMLTCGLVWPVLGVLGSIAKPSMKLARLDYFAITLQFLLSTKRPKWVYLFSVFVH